MGIATRWPTVDHSIRLLVSAIAGHCMYVHMFESMGYLGNDFCRSNLNDEEE